VFADSLPARLARHVNAQFHLKIHWQDADPQFAEHQISEVLFLHKQLGKAEARAKVVELLNLVGLGSLESRLGAMPHELSGGQQQRVMIAMALANEPDLLIADEPTTAVDVTIQAQILELLRDLQAEFGMALLLITHDLGIARRMAKRVCVMSEGLIVEQGPLAQVFDDMLVRSVPFYLEQQRLLSSTIIVFLADHGADQRIRRNRLFNYYQEVLGVPFFLFIPKKFQAALDAESPAWRENLAKPTSNTDLVPTVAQLLGIHTHSRVSSILQELDGKSVLAPLPKSRRMQALNTNSLRKWTPEGFALIQDGRYKYIFDEGKEYLFDLKVDPGERVNLLPAANPLYAGLYRGFLFSVGNDPRLSRIYAAHKTASE